MSEDAKTVPGVTPTQREDDDPFAKTTLLPSEMDVESGGRLQVGSVLRERFMLQECVAGGGMGIVYKALDRRLAEVEGIDPWVAIKVLSPQLAGNAQALRALQQEAAKGRCLSHPNIVRFVDFDREGDTYFIVLEWLEGRSLAAILDSDDPLPDMTTSLDIVRQVGEALSYAHRCGVVHADVKPGNIMISPSGVVKLFDFGIARVRQQQKGGPRFDPGVLAAATPAYSSMQVLTGEEPVAADDVFSLACLAYRLFAGHRVFGPRNAAEAAEAGMEPQRPQKLSDAQWKALRKALAHSRVARFASPAEFLDALFAAPKTRAPAAVERDEPLSVPHDSIVKRRYETTQRHWPYAVLAILAIAVTVTLLRPAWVSDSLAVAESWIAQQFGTDAGGGEGPAKDDAEPTAVAETNDEAAPGSAIQDPVPRQETDVPAPRQTADTGDRTANVDDREPPAPNDDAGTDEPDRLADENDAAPDDGAAVDIDTATAGTPLPDADAEAAIAEAEGSEGLVLAAPGEARPQLDLSLEEGGDPVVVDVYRWFGLSDSLTVRIDEVGYSGNRSPRDAGQYSLSDNGVISFDPGQRRTTLEIAMASDNDREPDQQVSLLLRDYYNVGAELGMVNLRLLDDDQRTFESQHAVNTIAFSMERMSVPERDPAVQIDVLRLNPDQRTMTVRYSVEDVSATDGEDYFSPGRKSVTFGPGQRSARLLIPLVQDARAEPDETFAIELDVEATDANTFRRIAVIIRDDD